MINWEEHRLKELCKKVSYGYTASATEENTGVRFLRITDIVPSKIDWKSVPFCPISENDYEKYKLAKNDIVIARTGATVGYAKQIRHEQYKSVFASYLVRLKLSDKVNKEFVGKLVESNVYKNYIWTIAGGSAQPNANAQDLTSFRFKFPPVPIQQKIAAVLAAYDDLIENNNRRIALLERMAEELYREWFVRMRFPGYEKAKFSKDIPVEWNTEKVKNIVSRKRFGRIYRESELVTEGNVIVIDQSTKEFLGFYNGIPEHIASESEPILLFGDHSCKMQIMTEPFSLAENVIPFVPKNKMPSIFLYYLVHSLVETSEYKRHWTDLTNKQVYIPLESLQKEFAEIVQNNITYKISLKRINRVLEKSRDMLLSRLISGKLSVEHLDIQFPPSMEEHPPLAEKKCA